MAEEETEKKKSKKKDFAGLFIPAGLFIGMGVGFAVDDFAPWMFIGLGGGFLLFALAVIFMRD